MRVLFLIVFLCVYHNAVVILAKHYSIINENWVCHVKRSCLACLRLSQCSWCAIENKCYSEELNKHKGYCQNATLHHIVYGMSLEENAECSCASGKMERNCVQPGGAQEEECSGRGKCICGRCFCDPNPDPDKAVMGEYCEFDNFSCDGPKCNEGPYSINDLKTNDEDNLYVTNVTQPLED